MSVWSSPEVLKHPKKLDEPTTPMDVYSFGVMMWEIFHEEVPFGNSVSDCTEYVCGQDARPQIQELSEEDDEDEEAPRASCTLPISNLIRQCWVKEPSARPDFNYVIAELMKEIGFYKEHTGNETQLINESESD